MKSINLAVRFKSAEMKRVKFTTIMYLTFGSLSIDEHKKQLNDLNIALKYEIKRSHSIDIVFDTLDNCTGEVFVLEKKYLYVNRGNRNLIVYSLPGDWFVVESGTIRSGLGVKKFHEKDELKMLEYLNCFFTMTNQSQYYKSILENIGPYKKFNNE